VSDVLHAGLPSPTRKPREMTGSSKERTVKKSWTKTRQQFDT
jgi:hypothetical protein